MRSSWPFCILFIFGCACLIWLTACDKDTPSAECENLANAMKANNKDQARVAITYFIDKLPSKIHSTENLKQLAANIEASCPCRVSACYMCIDTNPLTSEFHITFSSRGSNVAKTIDLSANTANHIQFRNMHE